MICIGLWCQKKTYSVLVYSNFVCVVIVAERGDTVPLKELRELSVVDRALSKAQKVRSKYQEKVRSIVSHTDIH